MKNILKSLCILFAFLMLISSGVIGCKEKESEASIRRTGEYASLMKALLLCLLMPL